MRTTKNRWRLTLLVLMAAAAGLGFLLWSHKFFAAHPKLEIVTVADSRMLSSALIYVALARGYFADEGLDLRLQSHAYGKLALASALDGKADLATVAEVPFANAVLAGRKPKLIAGITFSDKDLVLLTTQAAGIHSARDLAGKSVGMIAGTNSETFLRLILGANRLSTDDVKLVAIKPEDAPALLASGKLDAVSGWLSVRLNTQALLKERLVVISDASAFTECWLLTASEEFVAHHPATLKKILRALIRAEHYARGNPAQAQILIRDRVNIPAEAIQKYWPDFNFVVDLNQVILINLEYMARVAQEDKVNARAPNFLPYIAFDDMTAVAPARVTIPH